MFLKISQNPQENTCTRVSYLIKLQVETLAQVFSCEFGEFFKNTFFTENHWGSDDITADFLLILVIDIIKCKTYIAEKVNVGWSM